MYRPLIGITSYARDRSELPAFSLPCGYVDSLRTAGALPIVLPAGEGAPDDLLARVDALILAGGGDIDPAAYGGAPHETIYSVCEERDAFEFELARAAVRDGRKPLLCICRGMQVLNVVDGGTLHSHVPDHFGEAVHHRRFPRLTSRHPVRIAAHSRLASMLGAEETEVCSWHHQALDRLGTSLQPVAWAGDGLIEAVEHVQHAWCIGVQWHPEMQPEDQPQQRLFAAFVAAAAGRANLS